MRPETLITACSNAPLMEHMTPPQMIPTTTPPSAPSGTSFLQAGHEGRWLPCIWSALYTSPGCSLMDLHPGFQTGPRMLGTCLSRGPTFPAVWYRHHFLGNEVSHSWQGEGTWHSLEKGFHWTSQGVCIQPETLAGHFLQPSGIGQGQVWLKGADSTIPSSLGIQFQIPPCHVQRQR